MLSCLKARIIRAYGLTSFSQAASQSPVGRRVHQNIELDQSLRQSRTIWASLAVFVLPISAAGIFFFFAGLAVLLGSDHYPDSNPIFAIWDIIWGGVLVLLDVFLFGRVREASRRIRMLHENPAATVRPLPAPFQASLFGPYY